MNIHIQVFVWIYVFISLQYLTEVKFLGNMVTLYLTFWGTVKPFPKGCIQFYIPTNGVHYSKFFYLTILVITSPFYCSQLVWSGILLIYTSLITNNGHLYVCSLANCISSLEKCLQIFAYILVGLSFVILSLLSLIKYMNCSYTHCVGFHFILQHLLSLYFWK